MRAGIITALVLHLLMFATAFAVEPAALEPFGFLVGEWAATGSGQPGDGIGTAVFTRDLHRGSRATGSVTRSRPRAC